MTGEFDFAEMGWIMTTLDWNGDGFDDLVAVENQWSPNGFTPTPPPFPYGKLYVYFGGPNFDSIPEMEIPGTHEIEYGHTASMCNAGDMNGDGIDDLALFRATMYEGTSDQNYDLQLCVFYGGATPDTIPDYVLTFPREEWNNQYCFVRGLGDINLDGHDELGYDMVRIGYPCRIKFGIIYGGSMENTDFREISNIQDTPNITGIGDINGDGISDFTIGYCYGSSINPLYRIIAYYGNSSSAYDDSLVIHDSEVSCSSFSYPAGDVNGDGYSDFISVFTGSSANLYFGGPGIDGTNFVNISPPYHGDAGGEGFAHGDVNGNGTDDLMGSFCSQANGYGDAYLWMGGVPMNGTPDLHITPPTLDMNTDMFGFCLTMGDYNGDGCCDAAISAPFDYAAFGTPGRVFVYAGNQQLNDPTPIADNTETPVISKLQLYPNPLQSWNSELNVRFTVDPPTPLPKGGVLVLKSTTSGDKKSSRIPSQQSKLKPVLRVTI